MDIFLEDSLKNLESEGLKRHLHSVEGSQGREIIVDGRKVLNFCSNNYLGLADDPRLRQAALESMENEGIGSGASRLVCGNMGAHRRLEEKIAQFKSAEDCLVFSTGYMANVGIISSVFERSDIIFSDKLNHASIIDGILLSGAAFKRYPHKDMDVLEEWLKEARNYFQKSKSLSPALAGPKDDLSGCPIPTILSGFRSRCFNRDADETSAPSETSVGIKTFGHDKSSAPATDSTLDSCRRTRIGSKGFRRIGIITDSVFSMDGDLAPLDKIVELARRYNALVMIDEAHALGVLGQKGTGAAEHFGVEKKIDIHMGTLSKAAGVFGAYCCGSKTLISFLINRARSFIYTTGLPPLIAACARRAIEIIEHEPHRRTQLHEHSKYMRRELNQMGFDTLESQTPIIPILVKESNRAIEFSQKLFENGIFVQAIRPPTVPQNTARLRLTVMAAHQRSDLDFALEKLQQTGRELCLI